jgi:hypothetical protein
VRWAAPTLTSSALSSNNSVCRPSPYLTEASRYAPRVVPASFGLCSSLCIYPPSLMPPLPLMRLRHSPTSHVSLPRKQHQQLPNQPHQPARPSRTNPPGQPARPTCTNRPAQAAPSPGCGAAAAPAPAHENTTSHTGTTRHAISDRSPVLVAITTKTGERSAVPHYVPGACQATVHRGAYQEHHAHLKSSSAPSPHPRPRAILTEESCASLRLPLGPAPFTSPASCAPAFLPGPFPAGLE